MTRIKICGLRREEDIQYANACMPDYIGFVFAKSKRQVTKEQAKQLKKGLSPEIASVGVFVNEEIATIVDVVKAGIIDIVQLHGDESNDYIRNLRELLPEVSIIKAVRVASQQDITASKDIEADYLLFDSFSLKEYGGTGETFDWNLLKDIEKPYFLAGGINTENVHKAIRVSNAYAIDVSSAVETDGYKDREKMTAMTEAVRTYTREW